MRGGRYDPYFVGDKLIKVTRGFGYWCWKPQVILQSLRQINDNDILIYADIGCEFNPKGVKGLLEKLEVLKTNEIMGFACTEQDSKLSLAKFGFDVKEKTWAKMDIFHHFGVQNDPKFTDTPTIAATMMMMMKTPKTLKIINEWFDVFKTHFHLIDDSPSIVPNDESFQENRHDQSIWSIINKKHNLKNFLYSDIEPVYNSKADGTEFGFIAARKRNTTMGNYFDTNGNFIKTYKISSSSKTLKRFLKIGGKILPSRQARVWCRQILLLMNDDFFK